jgi:hypothetical protein
MIIQTDAGDLDFVPEDYVERRGICSWCAKRERGYAHRFGAQINKLIFDLRTPILVKQPFDSSARAPTYPGFI